MAAVLKMATPNIAEICMGESLHSFMEDARMLSKHEMSKLMLSPPSQELHTVCVSKAVKLHKKGVEGAFIKGEELYYFWIPRDAYPIVARIEATEWTWEAEAEA